MAMGGISQCAAEREIKYSFKLEQLKKSLEAKVQSTPLENRIDPNLQIACQALDDAKYCAENEDIREMFANLIASTMDNRVSKTIHPSFSSILKQMSSSEAKFLLKIREKKILPLCNILITYKETGDFFVRFNDLYLETFNPTEQEIVDNAFILSTLARQGLIEISYNHQLANNSIYDVFENSMFFKRKAELEEKGGNESVTLQKGSVELTNMGKRFLQVCCPPSQNRKEDVIPSNLETRLNILVSEPEETQTTD